MDRISGRAPETGDNLLAPAILEAGAETNIRLAGLARKAPLERNPIKLDRCLLACREREEKPLLTSR